MGRGARIAIGVLVVLAVLLTLNTIVVNQETKSAEVTVDGGELLELSGGEVQVTDSGPQSAPAIVLIHCYTCAIDWWEAMVPLLERRHRVITIDLLGHGGSEKPREGYAMDEQAALVAEALSRLEVRSATVVGHSLGGTVATALAEQSPDLVSGLVIVDQAPDNSYGELDFLARLSYWPVIGEAIWRTAPDFAIEDGLGQAFAPGFEVPDAFVDDLKRMTFTSYQETVSAEDDFTEETPLDERAAAAGVPLLVIFGAEDQIYDAREALAAYRDVPGARTELIEAVGHSPNVEAPAKTAGLVIDFARSLEARAPELPEGPKEPASTIERGAGGRLAGTLVVSPQVVRYGDTLAVSVENRGELRMLFGLGNRLERRAGSRWVPAAAPFFGTGSPTERDLLLGAEPGEVTGPRYGAIEDEVRIPEGLRPGLYRVVKPVSAPSRGNEPGPTVSLSDTFLIRRG